MSNWLFSFPLQETPPPFKVPLKPVEILSQCNSCLGLHSHRGKEQLTSSVPLQGIQIPGALEDCCPDKEFLLGKNTSCFLASIYVFLSLKVISRKTSLAAGPENIFLFFPFLFWRKKPLEEGSCSLVFALQAQVKMPGKKEEALGIAHLLLELRCITWKAGREDTRQLIPVSF